MTDDVPSRLADVSARAGVSISTASRVLNNAGRFSESTRRRVLEAAAEVKYRRLDSRRGRPIHSASTIELVLGYLHTDWDRDVIDGAWSAATAVGFDLVLTLERNDAKTDWVERVAARTSRGVVVGLITPTRSQVDRLRALNLPIVLLDPRSDPSRSLTTVGTTDREGGSAAGRHLAQCGYETFIVILGRPSYRYGRERLEGFRQSIAASSAQSLVKVITTDWTGPNDLRRDLTKELRECTGRVGIFACNDVIALRASRIAQDLGHRVPEQVGIVGFDDDKFAATADPPLTTIHQPIAQMAYRAVELVHAAGLGVDQPHTRIEFPTRFVARESTASTAGLPLPQVQE